MHLVMQPQPLFSVVLIELFSYDIPDAALVVAGVVALASLALVVRRATRSPVNATSAGALSPDVVTPALPPPPAIPVSLPPSETEQHKKLEAERLRAEALAARKERAFLDDDSPEASARREALKLKEEEAKKQAYRVEKEALAEEKERKKQERAEAERAAQIERETAARLEKERLEAVAAAERTRIDAERGQTLSAGLKRTRSEGFIARLNGLFGQTPRAIDESVLAELEEVLFTADIGVKTASSLVALAREKAKNATSFEALKQVIRTEIERIVSLPEGAAAKTVAPPRVMMVVGVNGAGKTTTIGKLAAKAVAEGKKVVLAAGDTFRAAATEQLDVWAERAKAQLVRGKEGADPSSVIFEAIQQAKSVGADLVIADTAGRLHTKVNLMEELKKVRRVADKALAGAPHEVLLVLDATNGQNAIAQATQFHEAVGLTGIALTKIDGTAKGGVIIGICDELKVPVRWVGVGEKVDDLKPFDPQEFVAALFDDT
jgi:fused signal recognition particle receptor